MTHHPEDQGKLRRYILGSLPEEESQDLERRYFADRSIFEEILAEEGEILDAYVSGDLPDDERRRFEKLLNSSYRLRKRAAFATTLLRLAPPRRRRVTMAVLLMAAALVLAVGSLWVVRESRRRPSAGEVAVYRETAVPVVSVSTVPPAAETPSASASRTPASSRPDARIVSFVLAAGLTRNGADPTLVSIPRGAETVELVLPLEADEHAGYSVSLQTAAGADVLACHGLRAREGKGGRIVAVEVPAGSLPPGDYLVTLSGERRTAASEALAEYAFRVRKN